MKNKKRTFVGLILALVVSVACVAQVNRETSPYERYQKSTVNEFEFRKTKFDVAAMRLSFRPALPSGLGIPFVEGETAAGKLVIQVEVYSSALPQTVDARKDAMMEAVGTARAAFSCIHGSRGN
jgi:hypothetical protein